MDFKHFFLLIKEPCQLSARPSEVHVLIMYHDYATNYECEVMQLKSVATIAWVNYGSINGSIMFNLLMQANRTFLLSFIFRSLQLLLNYNLTVF